MICMKCSHFIQRSEYHTFLKFTFAIGNIYQMPFTQSDWEWSQIVVIMEQVGGEGILLKDACRWAMDIGVQTRSLSLVVEYRWEQWRSRRYPCVCLWGRGLSIRRRTASRTWGCRCHCRGGGTRSHGARKERGYRAGSLSITHTTHTANTEHTYTPTI